MDTPVSLVAVKNMAYAGRAYVAGDVVLVRPWDVTVLKLARLAVDATDAQSVEDEPGTYRTADLSAEAKTPRRRTRRADMVAGE